MARLTRPVIPPTQKNFPTDTDRMLRLVGQTGGRRLTYKRVAIRGCAG